MPDSPVRRDAYLDAAPGVRKRGSGRKAATRLTITLLCLTLLGVSPARAGRPLDTEDTGTLDPGTAEVELYVGVVDDSGDRAWASAGVLNVGLARRLEASMEIGGAYLQRRDEADQAGVIDLLVGLKYRLLDETQTWPALLASVRLRLPTGDAGRGLGSEGIDVLPRLAVSKTFGSLTLIANGGYTFVTADRALDSWLLSGATEYQLAPAWTAVAEVVSFLGARDAPDVAVARAGLVHVLGRSIRLDMAVGVGLTRHAPSVLATAGVTIPF